MISDDVMRKYRDAIALLQFKKSGTSFHGELVREWGNKVALKLTCIYHVEPTSSTWGGMTYSSKIFKYADTEDKAIMYFVKSAQNRVF